MEKFHKRDRDLLFSCEELWTSTMDEYRTPLTTFRDTTIRKEGKKKVKTPNFQTEM